MLEAGYLNINFIYNLGSMFYINFLILSLFLLSFALTRIKIIVRKRLVSKVSNLIERKLNRDMLIRLFLELNFELGICSYLQL